MKKLNFTTALHYSNYFNLKTINKIIILLMMMILNSAIFSQDLISFKDGNTEEAIILEITPMLVKYKKFNNNDPLTYTILQSDILMIKYKNGILQTFSDQTIANIENNSNLNSKKLAYDQNKYSGPKVGFTVLGPGIFQERLKEKGYSPFIVQFGWQFETRIFTLENGTSGLLEWILLIGGAEKGLFLPSVSMLMGLRDGKNGFEFGLGPNLSLSGIGMAFAIGGSIKYDRITFPINLAMVPSVNVDNTNNNFSGNNIKKTGLRLSLLVGFNAKVK